MSTQTADPTTQAPTEPTDQGGIHSDQARAKARANQPVYGLQKAEGGLPPQEAEDTGGSRGRSDLYLNLLAPLTQDMGEWYEIAYFKTPNGAQQALKAIQEGVKVKVTQPDGTETTEIQRRAIPAGDWEMETRRFVVKDENGGIVTDEKGKPVKHSKLFARFMGNPTD